MTAPRPGWCGKPHPTQPLHLRTRSGLHTRPASAGCRWHPARADARSASEGRPALRLPGGAKSCRARPGGCAKGVPAWAGTAGSCQIAKILRHPILVPGHGRSGWCGKPHPTQAPQDGRGRHPATFAPARGRRSHSRNRSTVRCRNPPRQGPFPRPAPTRYRRNTDVIPTCRFGPIEGVNLSSRGLRPRPARPSHRRSDPPSPPARPTAGPAPA